MVPCPHCGEGIEEGAQRCPHCGSDEETGWNPEGDVYGVLPDLDEPEEEEEARRGGVPRVGLWGAVLVAAGIVFSSVTFWGVTWPLIPTIAILACAALASLARSSRKS